MSTSPYTCCSQCLVLFDHFSRDELGCDWREFQGDWSLADGALQESGTNDALVVAWRSATDLSFWIIATIPEVVENAVYRVIANYVDPNNYHVAEFNFTTTTLSIRLYKRSGGNNGDPTTKSYNVNWVGDPGELVVCLSEKVFQAQFDPEVSIDQLYAACTSDVSLHAEGYQAGLGNGSAHAIEYSSFLFQETGYTVEGCLTCYCKCPCDPLLKDLKLTLVSQDCPDLDGCTWDLIRQGVASETWILNEDQGTCPSVLGAIAATLTCDADAEEDGCSKYRLWFNLVTSECPVTQGDHESPSACTCEPFYLRYAGYVMGNAGDCGLCENWPSHFDIEIWDPNG
jgi:hypothetical protein